MMLNDRAILGKSASSWTDRFWGFGRSAFGIRFIG
jgi:hypothetical protein